MTIFPHFLHHSSVFITTIKSILPNFVFILRIKMLDGANEPYADWNHKICETESCMLCSKIIYEYLFLNAETLKLHFSNVNLISRTFGIEWIILQYMLFHTANLNLKPSKRYIDTFYVYKSNGTSNKISIQYLLSIILLEFTDERLPEYT